MNKVLVRVFVASFVAIGLAGLAGWALYTPPKPNHRAVLVDSSDSAVGDRCEDLARLVGRALSNPATNDKTKLAVFLTGDPATANEPHGLGSFGVPHRVKLAQGNDAVDKQRNAVLKEVRDRCERTPQAQNSSVFLALKRAVEHLRNVGCGAGDHSRCEILAQTDLQENADPQVRAALSVGRIDPEKSPPRIDNLGIAIRFCGTSQTKGLVVDAKGKKTQITRNRDTARAESIEKVWKGLFTQPELLTFAPYCAE